MIYFPCRASSGSPPLVWQTWCREHCSSSSTSSLLQTNSECMSVMECHLYPQGSGHPIKCHSTLPSGHRNLLPLLRHCPLLLLLLLLLLHHSLVQARRLCHWQLRAGHQADKLTSRGPLLRRQRRHLHSSSSSSSRLRMLRTWLLLQLQVLWSAPQQQPLASNQGFSIGHLARVDRAQDQVQVQVSSRQSRRPAVQYSLPDRLWHLHRHQSMQHRADSMLMGMM